jgi:3-hydroxybutyryl-CoA dehydratase
MVAADGTSFLVVGATAHPEGATIVEWQIGQVASFSKTISESDIYLFAGITGDLNPVHVNDPWAKESPFGGRIAHGMLGASFICTVLGMSLPGAGTIHVEQSLQFMAPIRIGDTITAHVEITALDRSHKRLRLRLRTWVTNQTGATVTDGSAVVIPPE